MTTVLSKTPPAPDDVEPAVRALLATIEPVVLAADRRINPGRWVLLPKHRNADRSLFAGRSEALGWLDANIGVVRGCVRIAHETGRHETAWSLCDGLWGWLAIRKDWRIWRTTHELGLEAAQRCDATAQARMLAALASLYVRTQVLNEAERLLTRARALWVSADHTLGEASALEALGVIELQRDNPVAARRLFTEARMLFSQEGRERGVVLMERRLGEAYRDTGDHDLAESHLSGALAWFRAADDPYKVLRTGRSLALTLRAQQRHDAARELLEEMRGIAEDLGAMTDAAELSRLAESVRAGA